VEKGSADLKQVRIRQNSLVVYRTRPARVTRIGKKLEIELGVGESLLVRPKDVMHLHPGPILELAELASQRGEVETAWELLAGGDTDLQELAELIHGAYTPQTAWATWSVVEDGLYFHGMPEEITARSGEEVARERAAREEREAREQARATFLERIRAGRTLSEDDRFLRKVEDLALGRKKKSRLLRELGRAETPESAHALLLETGYWEQAVDPYPQRLGLPLSPVEAGIGALPEEMRVDLTHLEAYAIDDEGNQDPDDAVSLDGDRLWVHVADVAALVTPNSEADVEARGRGATLYLPELTVPMLPWSCISSLGLGLAEVSPALSIGLGLGPAGEVVDVEVAPSWVRVHRVTYQAVDARLEEEPFRSLYAISQMSKAHREAQGAISLDLPEVRIRVRDDQIAIEPVVRLRSREMVTEAMLMAGEAVARFATEQNVPIPFTTQDPPETEERPQDLAGMYGLRRLLKTGQQSGVPGPHAGLGLEVYAQATSPLRRYLDLVVHQQLRAHLSGSRLLDTGQVLERIGATDAVAGVVRQAERLARKHWTLVYLMRHPGWEGEGVLVEQRGRRGTFVIPELDLDARVHLPRELPLNSRLPLTLRGVNLALLEAHFQIASFTR
jgi:exoribonuclease-2